MSRDIAERFASDTAKHVMTVLHDDGLYRHVRFAAPDTGFYWFDLVTWPGKLSFTGDMDGYTFSRITDMFEFFRSGHDINPGYWSEKVVASREGTRRYSEEVLRESLKDPLAEHEKNYPELAAKYEADKSTYDALPREARYPFGRTREPVKPRTPSEVYELIAEYDDDGQLSHEAGARELLAELETAGIVSDVFEWHLTDWDWSFLWACHAIKWGIAQYDAARVPVIAS